MTTARRTLYLALLIQGAHAHAASAQVPSTWKQIGKAGQWNHSLALSGMDGRFWSLDSDGSLHATDPSGAALRIGKPGTYAGSRLFLAVNGRVYNLQQGTMYATDSTGERIRVREAEAWSSTTMIAGMNGELWSIEGNGTIFRTDAQGAHTRITEGGLQPRMLTAMGGKLWAIEAGSLWSFEPGRSTWEPHDAPEEHRDAIRLLSTPGYLWELDSDGTLYRSEGTGRWVRTGARGEYLGVQTIVALGVGLYALKRGTLYLTR